jgi:AraC family transcriptional regulator of adaptative response / DNA-3-methyladenine glycosylase II
MQVEQLAYTPPLAAASLIEFLALRAVPGVEEVVGDVYRRVLRVDDATGVIAIRVSAERSSIELELDAALAPVRERVVAGARRLVDADADPVAIDAVLRADPRLRPLVDAYPGMRVPGAFDGFEIAVRAVLGQQISVAAARTLASRLAARLGDPLEPAQGGLAVSFPRAEAIAGVTLDGLGMPASRGATIVGLAQAVCDGRVDLAPAADPERARAALLALPGIGPWTAAYVAMRAFADRDAFPSSDLVLRQVLGRDQPATTRAVEQLSRAWSPWRAYAVVRLWVEASEARLARGAA